MIIIYTRFFTSWNWKYHNFDVCRREIHGQKRHMHLTEEILKQNPNICKDTAPSLDDRQHILVAEVPKLGQAAAEKAIAEWGQPRSNITHLIFCTTNGIDMPGADLHLAKLISLRPSVKRIMMYQQGCYGGAAALRIAKDLAKNNTGARVLVVRAEIMAMIFPGPSERIFWSSSWGRHCSVTAPPQWSSAPIRWRRWRLALRYRRGGAGFPTGDGGGDARTVKGGRDCSPAYENNPRIYIRKYWEVFGGGFRALGLGRPGFELDFSGLRIPAGPRFWTGLRRSSGLGPINCVARGACWVSMGIWWVLAWVLWWTRWGRAPSRKGGAPLGRGRSGGCS